MRAVVYLLFCILMLTASPVLADGKTIVLASLEWPPYTGSKLPGQGATTEVVRAALKAVGYKLEVRFFPWKRTITEVHINPEIAGYFPEYPSRAIMKDYLVSRPIGSSPLGFAEQTYATVSWENLRQLRDKNIGVVRGYVNEEEFDEMVRLKLLQTTETVNDTLNLRMLIRGRVDLAVIDTHVFAYLMDMDPSLKEGRDKLRINKRLLTIHPLHVCFKQTAQGRKFRRILNKGLSIIHANEVQSRYMHNLHINE